MVGSSKILTVSYGTFSCTLEGFEDSFDTMKAIAEYFRDLAADDRYFGAEPPTPDADMLARIAEREIARRVEARTEGAGIVLRAAPAAAQPLTQPSVQPAAAAPVAAPTPAPAPARVAPPVAAPVAEAPRPAAAPHEGESVAEKLQRIRAVVSQPAAAPIADAALEDEGNDDIYAAFQMEAASAPSPAPAPVAEDIGADDIEADTDVMAMIADLEEAEELPSPAALAADLDAEGEDQFAVEAPEVLAVDDIYEATPELVAADEPIDLDKLLAEEAEVAASATAAETDHEAIAEWEDAADQDEAADDSQAAYADDLADVADDVTEPEPASRPYLLRVPRAEVEEVIAEATAFADDYADEDQDDGDAAFDDYAEDDDFQNLAELDGIDELDAAAENGGESTLSPEDEADLQAELEDAAREARGQRTGRAMLEQSPSADDSISRLLSRADAAMNEPEGKGRRAAIAHLKAAVAATEAARRMGEPERENNGGKEAFRADLDQAVRPRRAPVPAEARTERPRPAPLRLVASQRIDVPQEGGAPRAPIMPVRPRRVMTSERAPVADAGAEPQGFAKFAAAMGASDLADLIEAAAVHTIHIEGFEDFTRPQLMDKVRGASLSGFGREEGLRIFGILLREGTIERTANGRFTVTDESRFAPARRAAQG